MNAGEGNGKPHAWYNENKIPQGEIYNPDYRPFPDAESDRDLWNRIYPFYQKITSNDEENIIIVSHGTALSFLQSMLFGNKFNDRKSRRMKGRGGSVSKFVIETDGGVTLCYLNRERF